MAYQKIEGKRILVTGGAGFIGSHLCESFLSNGNHVVCFDNLSTGYKHNIEHFLSNEKFVFIEADIRDADLCDDACRNIDLVFHQAALGSVPRSIKDPITSVEVNITGFVNVLKAAVNNKVKRFVYAASSSTYGDHKALPKQEDVIGKPLSPYAITKYANELFAENFAEIYGIEAIGLRYFNVFGPKQDPNGAYAAVIPKFANELLNHESPVINGDGTYSRDFTFIDNVVQANHLAGLVCDEQALNTVYNVAFGERTDLNQLYSFIKEGLSKYDSAIKTILPIHGKNRDGDIPHSHADISKAKSLLGYCPEFSVREGLLETCDWYVKQNAFPK